MRLPIALLAAVGLAGCVAYPYDAGYYAGDYASPYSYRPYAYQPYSYSPFYGSLYFQYGNYWRPHHGYGGWRHRAPAHRWRHHR